MIHKLQCALESTGELVKAQISASLQGFSRLAGNEGGPESVF